MLRKLALLALVGAAYTFSLITESEVLGDEPIPVPDWVDNFDIVPVGCGCGYDDLDRAYCGCCGDVINTNSTPVVDNYVCLNGTWWTNGKKKQWLFATVIVNGEAAENITFKDPNNPDPICTSKPSALPAGFKICADPYNMALDRDSEPWIASGCLKAYVKGFLITWKKWKFGCHSVPVEPRIIINNTLAAAAAQLEWTPTLLQ